MDTTSLYKIRLAACLVLLGTAALIVLQQHQSSAPSSGMRDTGYNPFVNTKAADADVQILIYETETTDESPSQQLVAQASRLDGVEASLFGEGQEYEGFGSKYAAVYPILESMNPRTLVVLSDGRDVLINNPSHTSAFSAAAVQEFLAAYNDLTHGHPEAIVVSAEAQCCVSALTHVAPGGYYNKDGTRKQRSCVSGQAECMWGGDEKAAIWEKFMQDMAMSRTHSDENDDVYLNAGMIVGTAKNIMQVIDDAKIGMEEDDQAVLTDFMYNYPDKIILDYGQKMFGNNRWASGGMEGGGCTFQLPEETRLATDRLIHSKTGTMPLFLHSPGGFFECHDSLGAKLGVKTVINKIQRRLKKKNKCQYGEGLLCLGDGNGLLGLGIPDWVGDFLGWFGF